MNDCELLELAAKAAGYKIQPHPNAKTLSYLLFLMNGQNWNPLTDDGDALRLAVKLNIAVHPGFAYTPTGKLINYRDHANRIAATRRAIVCAAAEIGRGIAQKVGSDLPEDNYYKTQAEAEEIGRAAAVIQLGRLDND